MKLIGRKIDKDEEKNKRTIAQTDRETIGQTHIENYIQTYRQIRPKKKTLKQCSDIK